MNLDTKKIVCLRILCWAASMGGEHYTVKAECGSEFSDEITHPITTKEAIHFNKKDKAYGLKYKRGDLSGRFETRKAACREAVKYSRKKWPEAKLVLDGGWASPNIVVWCSDKKIGGRLKILGENMRALYKKVQNPWAVYKDKVNKMVAEWDELLEKLTK
jgi:hypothetical protein